MQQTPNQKGAGALKKQAKSKDWQMQIDLQRQLQSKLRKQRTDLHRKYTFDLKQQLEEQLRQQSNELNEKNEAEVNELTAIHDKNIQSLKNGFEKEMNVVLEQNQQTVTGLQTAIDHKTEEIERNECTLSKKEEYINELRKSNKNIKDEISNVIQSTKNEKNEWMDDSQNICANVCQWIAKQKQTQLSFETTTMDDGFEENNKNYQQIQENASKFVSQQMKKCTETQLDIERIANDLEMKNEQMLNTEAQLKNCENEIKLMLENRHQLNENVEHEFNQQRIEHENSISLLKMDMNRYVSDIRKYEHEILELKNNNSEHVYKNQIKELEKENIKFNVNEQHSNNIIKDLKNKSKTNEVLIEAIKQNMSELKADLQAVTSQKNDTLKLMSNTSEELIDIKSNSLHMQNIARKQIASLENALRNAMKELKDKSRDCSKLKQRIEAIADRMRTK